MSEQQQGPGRRLAGDEEERAALLFAGGATDRQVADALDVGAGTANRLRHRMAARIAELSGGAPADGGRQLEATVNALQTGLEISQAGEAGWRAELLEALRVQRGELLAALAAWQDRAQASRGAIAALDAERLELLAAGRDAAPLRPRRRDAEDDLADSTAAAGLVTARLAETEARIAGQEAEQRRIAEQDALTAARAAAEAANAEGERLAAYLATTDGGLLKHLAHGHVSAADAAARIAELHALAEAAGWPANWFDARLLPRQSLFGGDAWGSAVGELLAALGRGDVNSCYSLAPCCLPWQHRDEAFTARERAEIDRQAREQKDKIEGGLALNARRGIEARRGAQPAVQPEVLAQMEAGMRVRAVQAAYAKQHLTAADLRYPWLPVA